MKTLSKILLAPFRLLGGLFTTGLLILIVVLLAMDPVDRRPFMKDTAVTGLRLGEHLLRQGRQQVESLELDSAEPTEEDQSAAEGNELRDASDRRHDADQTSTDRPRDHQTIVAEKPVSDDSAKWKEPLAAVREWTSSVEMIPDASPLDDMVRPASYRGFPSDFVRKVQSELSASPNERLVADWNRIWSVKSQSESMRVAIQLARDLPPEWWPVDGKSVSELDLSLFLETRARNSK